MKVSLYIENGVSQINFSAENDYEKNILKGMIKNKYDTQILEGKFGFNQVGYIRYWEGNPNRQDYQEPENLMLVLTEKIIKEKKHG